MHDKLFFSPDDLPIFRGTEAKNFCLLVTASFANQLCLGTSSHYSECFLKIFPECEDINDYISNQIPDDTDIFFIPYRLGTVAYPKRGILLAKQRLVIAQVSMQIPLEPHEVKITLESINNTSSIQLKESAQDFFKKIGTTDELMLFDSRYHAEACIKLNNQCLWSESIGVIYPKEMIFAPYGEITLTHKKLHAKKVYPMSINGNLIFNGEVILFNYATDDFTLNEQKELYKNLSQVRHHPIRVKIKNGDIIDLSPLTVEGKCIVNALEKLFSIHSQLSRIIEVGVGINKNIFLRQMNIAMNEPYGGKNNCVHFGFGNEKLAYHLDFICENTKIMTKNGTIIVGCNDTRLS